MALIGKQNRLPVLRKARQGIYLDGGEHEEILLPNRYIEESVTPGELVDVFVYRDSEDRVIATTEEPYGQVGEFATLEVIGVNQNVGAFLDWGLPKDLLLPFREQLSPVHTGDDVIVYIMLDKKTDRIVATMRWSRYVRKDSPSFKEGDQVRFLVHERTPLGYKAIVENAYSGLIYHTDLAGPLKIGQSLDGYVRAVRDGGKVDLSLDQAGYARVASLREQIMKALEAGGGELAFNDKSSPEDIREVFDVSKKAFKQAIGALYKKRVIEFTEKGIRRLG